MEKFRLKSEIVSFVRETVRKTALCQRRDFTRENRIIYFTLANPTLSAKDLAEKMGMFTGQKETAETLESIYRQTGFPPVDRRETFFRGIYRDAKYILTCLTSEQYDKDELEKKISDLDARNAHARRRTLLTVFYLCPSLSDTETFTLLMKLNKSFSAEVLDAILSYIKVEFDTSTGVADYTKEILRLEADLERANRMIQTLQDEFEERIEENRREEAENLMTMLNSPTYGHILDLLENLQSGIKLLRRKGISVPAEINATPSLVRNMLRFVEDQGITPVLRIGEELTVGAGDMDKYQYIGSPFVGLTETKYVKVIATGWQIEEKDIMIALPTVQEITEE